MFDDKVQKTFIAKGHSYQITTCNISKMVFNYAEDAIIVLQVASICVLFYNLPHSLFLPSQV